MMQSFKKKKLKTIEQIRKEFHSEYLFDGLKVYLDNGEYFIHKEMFKYFGKECEFEKCHNPLGYTHKIEKNGVLWHFHEYWFDDEFIKGDEFMI